MKFADFERLAQQAFENVPERYREGIDALVVSRETVRHPRLKDIYTLGHCDTEAYPSDWVGPDTMRSVVTVFFGSFQNLARLDPEFDWEAEVHETVEHEIRHHLESLASEDQLGGVDYAMDEDFKRGEGEDFDPWYYQQGEVSGKGVYVVEDHVFIEQEWSTADFDAGERISFRWRGRSFEVPRPDELGDIHFVEVLGVEQAPPILELVLVRKRTWWDGARRMFGSAPLTVLESEADASALR
jgi:hypothetical protein